MSGGLPHLALFLVQEPGLQKPNGAVERRVCCRAGGRLRGLLFRLLLVERLLRLQREVARQTARRDRQGAICK